MLGTCTRGSGVYDHDFLLITKAKARNETGINKLDTDALINQKNVFRYYFCKKIMQSQVDFSSVNCHIFA